MATLDTQFADLSDNQLLAEVHRLAGSERRATAAFIRSLMELDGRRLFLAEGYSSLFTYCTQALHLAEGSAYNRIEAARAARRFPVILDALEDGSLTVTAVRLLAPHITPDNHGVVIASARHKTKRRDRASDRWAEPEARAANVHSQIAGATPCDRARDRR